MKFLTTFLLFFLCSQAILAQDTDAWLETEATITEIHTNIKRRSTRANADVYMLDQKGDSVFGRVELMAIPFYGSWKDAGDTVSVRYNPENPYQMKSTYDNLVNTYGLYVLLFFGVVLSIRRIRKKSNLNG